MIALLVVGSIRAHEVPDAILSPLLGREKSKVALTADYSSHFGLVTSALLPAKMLTAQQSATMTTLTENQTTQPNFKPQPDQYSVGIWGGRHEKANSFELALTWKQIVDGGFPEACVCQGGNVITPMKNQFPIDFRGFIGGRYWDRTSDPCRVKAVLYR